MKAYLVFLIFLLASFNLTAQLRPDALKDDQQAPHYIQLMHKEVPNVFEVERAYKLYYANLPFTKNTYSQYYKRWMLWARKFMDNQGYVLGNC
ncbi:MAG: hypothetical protein IPM92_14575 [Saprospiraceae bacterium]|nr:hypothetical protein [Saprospiraceae bacterium]